MLAQRSPSRTALDRRTRLALPGILGWKLTILGCLACALLLAACSSGASPNGQAPASQPTVEAAVTSPAAQDPKPADDLETIQVKWQGSPHASTYVLEKAGQNAACARCHAPANWIPSMEDMPESCYACKFEIKPPPPLVSEADWEHVACKICHQVKKGKVQAEIAWLDIPPIEEYAKVDTAMQLCLKCHTAAEVPGHAGTQLAGAHADMSCTDCHDAHATSAGCTDAGCHADKAGADSGVRGHDANHTNVSCSACHDAGGLKVGPDSLGTWVTFDPAPAGESPEEQSITSHNTVKEAPCARCHYNGNPWGLSVTDAGAQ